MPRVNILFFAAVVVEFATKWFKNSKLYIKSRVFGIFAGKCLHGDKRRRCDEKNASRKSGVGQWKIHLRWNIDSIWILMSLRFILPL